MTKFYMAASDMSGKERCKATTVGLAKREATRRFAKPYSNGYIHLIEVDDDDTILSSYSRYAARGNRWFSNDLILEFDKLAIEEKQK